MKNIKYFFFTLILTLSIAGCSKHDSNPIESSDQEAFATDPADNATAVTLDKQIQLTFAKPVDRITVEKNFHLISENDIQDSVCSYGNSMMHGMMSMVMMDSVRMNHFVNFHSMHGKFQWNSDFTHCLFTSDSLLEPGTEYMMHFGKDMMQMMNDRMGDMMGGGMMGGGMMGGNQMSGMGTGQMQGHMMWHFTTKP